MRTRTTLVALGLLSAAWLTAATYYVAPGGNDANLGSMAAPWATIQHAVDTAGSTDTVLVAGGSYSENVSVTVPNTLTLRGGHNGSWAWTPGVTPSTITAAAAGSPVIYLRTASNTVSGFVLTGGSDGVLAAYGNQQAQTVSHCVIKGNSGNGITVRQTGSKTALNAINCEITGNTGDGINLLVDNCTTVSTVYNCTIANNGGSGYIDLHYYQQTTALRNNIIANNGGYGIRNFGGAHWDAASYNCVYNNATGNYNNNGYYTRLLLQGGNTEGYPGFVGGSDYSLSSTSVCVDAGTDLSGAGVSDDIYGNARSAPYDMGAYESSFSLVPRLATTYVDGAGGNDANNGSTPGTAKATIGAGIALTAAGGTCNVAAGSYADLVIDQADITVVGAGAGVTSLSLAGAPQVLTLDEVNIAVSGFTISGSPIGVMAAGPQTVSNAVEDCLITGNTYGVYGLNDNVHRRYIIDGCEVIGNTTGVYNSGGKCAAEIINSVVADNTSDGIYFNVDHSAYESFVYNCTVANNGQDGWHSVHNWHRTTWVTNSNFTGNGRYGIWHQGGAYNLTVTYSNAWGNTLADTLGGVKLVIGAGTISANPLYVGGGNYDLGVGSPSIDAGTDLSGAGIVDDIAGVARPIGGAYDIGAYESSAAAAATFPDTYADIVGGNDANDGGSLATAKQTIGAAIAVTDPNGTVHVQAGTYAGPISIPATLTVAGVGAGSVTLTDAGTVVTLNAAQTTIRGVTITGGTVGVEVSVESDDTLIDQCVITGNTKAVTAPGSGNNRRLHVERSELFGNDYGVYLSGGKTAVSVVNSVIAQNAIDGVYMSIDHAQLGNSCLNSTIADNGQDGWHATHYWTRTTTVTNSVITGNGRYGIWHNGTAYASPLSYSNLHGNGTADINNSGGGLVIGAGVISVAPAFIGGGNYDLLAGSPNIDAGTDLSGSGVVDDIAGTSRPLGAAYELGAYETSLAAATKYADTYVDGTGGNDANDGDTPGTAKQTIGAALAVTDTNGTCHVLAGTYSGPLSIPVTLTLEGAGADLVTLTDSGTVVTLSEANTTVRGVTISGGAEGVRVSVQSDDTLIDQCVISGNGRAVTAPNNGNNRRLHVERCQLINNDYGVYLSGGKTSLALINSIVAGNSTDGVYINIDHAPLANLCLNSTIADNGQDGWHATHYWTAATTFTNDIISGNGRYGIWHNGTAIAATLSYSDVYGNGTADVNNSGGGLSTGAGVISVDPQFVGGGDYTLGDVSPAINAGTDLSGSVTGDLAGDPRPALGGWDLGALELQNRNPNAVCQNVTVTLDGSGNASITESQVDDGSSDPDGDTVGFELDQTSFTCADVPSTTVTLTVTDGNGGSDTCDATVTVQTAGTCAEVTDAVYDLVCDSGASWTSGDEATAAIEAAWTTALGGSTVCDVPAATCLASILAAAGL